MEWVLDFYGCRSEFEIQIENAGQLESRKDLK
jgi:hypothetical protein